MQPLTDSSFRELLPDAAGVEDGELVLGGITATRARPRVRDAARRLRRGDAPCPGSRVRRRGARRPRRLRHEGVSVGRGAAALRRGGARRGRLDRRRARVRAPCRHPRRPARDPRQQQGGRAARTGRSRPGALIVLDSLDELERARALGAKRCLIRVTPGIEADTHEAVKTAHHGSKFGLPPDDAIEALRRLPECLGLHVHVGSQLMHFGAALMTVDWVAAVRGARAARARLDAADRRPRRRPRRAARASRSRRSRSASSSAASSASSAAPSSCRASPPPRSCSSPAARSSRVPA